MIALQDLSESVQSYLEVILDLEDTQKVARAKDIAERLGVKRGSVTGALKSLEERPAIVLLDIMMPGMHGFKVLDKIKETAPSTEVIVITGLDETVVGVESLERGAFEFVAKPINLEHLRFLLEFKLGQMGITD